MSLRLLLWATAASFLVNAAYLAFQGIRATRHGLETEGVAAISFSVATFAAATLLGGVVIAGAISIAMRLLRYA